MAFFVFCMAASAVYLMNDMADLNYDQAHPLKRLRPIASQKIGADRALQLFLLLGAVSIFLSFGVHRGFGWLMMAYLSLNLIYTYFLKAVAVLDVFCIAVFFLFRILAGAVTAEAALSPWLLSMAGLLALFLGFNKRQQELKIMKGLSTAHRPALAQYNEHFLEQGIAITGAGAGAAYMLYIVDEVAWKSGNSYLMFTIPFVYYGIFRYLYLIRKRKKGGDPARILLFDFNLQINLALWLIFSITAIYFHG